MALYNRMLQLRTERGWTQAQLAETIGVTRKTINTIERRVFVPSTVLALKIAAAFELPVEEVFWLAS